MKKALNATRYAFTLEGEHLPILIRRHPSSRRIVVRYQPLHHVISLTLPRYSSVRQGLRFIEEQREWIAHQVRSHPRKQPIDDGQTLSVLGKSYTLRHVGGRGVVRIEAQHMLVPGEKQFMARRVRDWLIRTAREEIAHLATHKAAAIGKPIKKIGLRDTISHWGSCSHDGSLSFSWRLALAPYHVLEYVVAHEVAHLAELNHGPAFWDTVAGLCSHWQESRDWIKTHGATLYAYA